MNRIPTLEDRFGDHRGLRPLSIRHAPSLDDRQAQKPLHHRIEQVMRMRIAVVAMAIAALIALALATRVAAQTVDTRMQIQSNDSSLSLMLTYRSANSGSSWR